MPPPLRSSPLESLCVVVCRLPPSGLSWYALIQQQKLPWERSFSLLLKPRAKPWTKRRLKNTGVRGRRRSDEKRSYRS